MSDPSSFGLLTIWDEERRRAHSFRELRRVWSARNAFGLLLALSLLCFLLASPASADFQTGTDQAGWDRTANIAQTWLAADEGKQHALSPDQWEDLRLTLTVERELSLQKAEQGSLSTRILLAQLASLGAPPANGAREPLWVASRRAELNTILAQAEAPLVSAREANARAGVLISDIDRVMNREERAHLFGRVDSPLDPAFWQAVAKDVRSADAPGQPTEVLRPDGGWNISSATGAIVAGLFAILAAIVAHRWVFALERKGKPSPKGHLGFAFLKDFADIGLPMLVILLALALFDRAASQLAVPPGLETAVITAGAIAIYLHWLGRSVFLPFFEPGRIIALPEKVAMRAVWISAVLGIVLAGESLIEYAEDAHTVAPTLLTLGSLAVIVCASLCVWLLTKMVRANREIEHPAGHPHITAKSMLDLLWPLSRLLIVAAIAAPLLALTGYVVLARDFLTAAIYSVTTICASLFLFRSVTSASDILFDRLAFRTSPSWQFVPLVFGFFLFVLTVPVLFMMWGVDASSILDWIFTVKDGVQIGQVRVSFGNVFAFGVTFLIGYFLTRWLQRVVQLALFPRLRLDPGGRAAMLTAVGYIGLTLSALIAVTAAGLDLTSLAFVAGALSVGVGFGLQSIVSNFVSGIILLIERPVKEGDWIEVGTISGHVRRIAFRSTHVETSERHEVIIPNSDLIAGSVTNLTYGGNEGRISLPIGIAYGADVERAKALLLAIAHAHPNVIPQPEPAVMMNGFGESAVDLTLLCFVEDVNQRGTVRSDLYFAAFKTLRDEKIEIPFPQREIRIRRDS